MRILYFSRDYTSHDHRFLSALAKTSHQILYLRLERGRYSLEEQPLPAEVELIPWRGGQRPVQIKNSLGLLADLKRVIQEKKPDLIQAGPIQRSAFLAAFIGFRPLVSMSWGYDLLQDASRNTFWDWATRYTLRRSSALVGDCDTIRQLAIAYGMEAERIVTFPWGIDLNHFSPADRFDGQPETLGENTFTLLSTRGWEPIYGTELIAQAFVKVAAHRPELRMVMLNSGSQAGVLLQIFSNGKNIRPDTNLDPSSPLPPVSFPGQIGYDDLPRFYQSADLYVSATHSDGTSISLLEAMACGCPVLVSDIPGNREWVEHDRNGWLFPDGDPDALANAILHAVEVRSRLAQMGIAARQVAEQRADWNRNFPNLFRAYEIALTMPESSLKPT
jgi:glycosyltransferase involved in cell wall biosynthesis